MGCQGSNGPAACRRGVSPERLDGRVAVVSGVGPGLGDEIARLLASKGARVSLLARSAEHVEKLAGEIRAGGGEALAVPTDIADAAQTARAVARTVEACGGIDVLVHNARARVPYRAFVDDDPASWELSFRVNVMGAMTLTQRAVPHLSAAGGGSIVFVGTMLTRKPLATMGPYAASKGALLTMAGTLAAELGPANIRVNTVVPGWMMGPSLQRWFEASAAARDGEPADEYAAAAARTALRRLPTAADCAQAVLFFASDMSAAVTGQTLDVNAGEVFA